MRVPNISIYGNATYNLGGLTGDLQDANEVLSTQKRINSISDDPIGLSQVLNLKTSIGNLDQIEKNVNMGISWLKGSENALDSVNDLILEAKTQVTRLVNASMNIDQRQDAIGSINGIIDQIITLGNTQINGNYILSGHDTDIPPLEYSEANGSQRVSYMGSESPFEIKTDKQVTVPVGRDGQTTFWEDRVEINSTNDTLIFKEDNGHGSMSQIIMETTIDYGTYSTDEIEVAVRNALNDASSKQGYKVNYEVEYDGTDKAFSIKEDGSYNGYIRTEFMWETGADSYVTKMAASSSIKPEDIDLTVVNNSALTIDTPEPHGTEPLRLTWQGDGNWSVNNNPGYTIIPFDISGSDDYIGIDLNESGFADITINLKTPVTQRGQFIEFDIVSAKGDHSLGHEIGFNGDNSIYAPPTSDNNAVFVTDLTIVAGVNDTINFTETNSINPPQVLSITIPNVPAPYTDMDNLASVIKTQMDNASLAGLNDVTYAVTYDAEESKFNIRQDGSSLDTLTIDWSSSNAASTLGYYSSVDTVTYPESSNTTPLYVTIDSTNNKLAFEENVLGVLSGTLWASVAEGTYKSGADLGAAVASAMEDVSMNGVDYNASYDAGANDFLIYQNAGPLTGLELLWNIGGENSIGETLGFDPTIDTGAGIGLGTAYTSDSDMVLMTFDATNNVIDFEEIAIDGTVSSEISITLPEGDYTEHDDIANEIQKALREASSHNVKYIVEYDNSSSPDKFMIKGSDADIKGFSLLWQTGPNRDQSAGEMLGFYGNDSVTYSESDEPVVNITIDATNNVINFREVLKGNEGKVVDDLTAIIEPKTSYTSHSQLALEVEKALEEESYQHGNRIDYSVSWDGDTKNFTIKENGTQLEKFDLMWQTGENAPLSAGGTGESIGQVLGFDIEDDAGAPVESDREVEWGVFNSLIDLNQYLTNNDTYGIERTLGRLDAHFSSMTSRIVDIGIKYTRLEIRDKITTENNLSLTERRSNIEDADVVEAIMNLQAFETAYQAALSSTAKIMNLSLVDFL